MLEINALRPWIADHLLVDEALLTLRHQMEEHPARLVVVNDLLNEAAVSDLAAFFSGGAEFEREFGLYSKDTDVTEDDWQRADQADRFFRFDKLRGIRPEAALEPAAIRYMRFRSWVAQPAFRGFMEVLTGLSLGPSDDFGAHRFRQGDFLRDHDDDNRGRRLSLVMYLTPDWRPEFGGALTMQHPDSDEASTVPASFNSMAVFDVGVGSRHRVEAISEQAGDHNRCTFGGWFPDGS